MEIISINLFEPIDRGDGIYMPYEDIIKENLLDNYKEFPGFIVVENEFHIDNAVIICNEHWFQDPKDDLTKTTYSSDTKLVGCWNITYKSA
jgi:hypothetical protein